MIVVQTAGMFAARPDLPEDVGTGYSHRPDAAGDPLADLRSGFAAGAELPVLVLTPAEGRSRGRQGAGMTEANQDLGESPGPRHWDRRIMPGGSGAVA
jgi:hypothetical protein